MSGPAAANPQPVTGKKDIIDWVASGEKAPSDFGIGAEHEKFILDSKRLRPLPYESASGEESSSGAGIGLLLEQLAKNSSGSWQPVYENERIIALKGTDGSSITLEPGGQFELSGALLPTIHHICQETNRHLAQVGKACRAIGASILSMGFFPELARQDFHWMPKGRYKIMREYMPKRGNLGLDMMLRTSTVQVNLDYASEADMAKKWRVATAMQPLAVALFASSPFVEGKPSGYKSWRSRIWMDTDPDRCGIPRFIFDEGLGYEALADYILRIPMYFVHRGDDYIDVSGKNFGDFLEGRLQGPQGEQLGQATVGDLADHATTAFPEARVKTFIEMRGADAGPWENLCALPAFWVGLLYDDAALEAAYAMIRSWQYEQVVELSQLAARDALDGVAEVGSIRELASAALQISQDGLKARARLGFEGQDERSFLDPALEFAETGKTIADRMLADYAGPWGGRIAPIYRAYGYCIDEETSP